MKDYAVTFTVRNNYLLTKLREAGFSNAAELSRASGVSYPAICGFLTFREAPVGKRGNWSQPALRLAKFFRCLPDELFPSQHIEKALAKNRAEVELSLGDMQALAPGFNDPQALPDYHLEVSDAEKILHDVLSELPERHRRMLMMRYIDGMTFEAIGEKEGISGVRVSQIIWHAENRLRHPSRKERLSDVLVTLSNSREQRI